MFSYCHNMTTTPPLQASHFIFICKRDILQNVHARVNDDHFWSLFGVSPEVCVPVYNFIRRRLSSSDEAVNFCPMHLLWSLHVIKAYGTSRNMALCLRTDSKTLRKWSLFVINKIASMHMLVVSHGCLNLPQMASDNSFKSKW